MKFMPKMAADAAEKLAATALKREMSKATASKAEEMGNRVLRHAGMGGQHSGDGPFRGATATEVRNRLSPSNPSNAAKKDAVISHRRPGDVAKGVTGFQPDRPRTRPVPDPFAR